MSLENGKCPCCNGALALDISKEKAVCKYCGHEIVIQQAVQKCIVDGIATFDTLLLAAEQAIEFDCDYDLARKKYKEALNLSPNDYRVLWGIYLCEIATLNTYLRSKGYVAIQGDMPSYVNDATQKYGERAKALAPAEVQPYYFKVINDNNTYFANQLAPQKKSGCYVATCVYGSYCCPEVWTLRRYRDYSLAASSWGRFLISLYYKTSPTIVRIFGKTKWFNRIGRKIVDKKVAKLWKDGVEHTPYEDKQW